MDSIFSLFVKKKDSTKPEENNASTLYSLGLFSEEITNLLERLTGISDEQWYHLGNEDNLVRVHFVRLNRKGRRFAVVDCESLCGIEDKETYLRSCIEQAAEQHGLVASYEDMAIGGMVSDQGRLAMFSIMRGHIPPAVHEYCLFKLSGEATLTIEDPRSGIFEDKVKFQSCLNDQICCFASASLFYAGFHIHKLRPNYSDTRQLLDHIYSNRHLKNLMLTLESKVGRSIETKEQVIESFITSLHTIVHDSKKLSPLIHVGKSADVANPSAQDINKGP